MEHSGKQFYEGSIDIYSSREIGIGQFDIMFEVMMYR
jgi:hypothetical protein